MLMLLSLARVSTKRSPSRMAGAQRRLLRKCVLVIRRFKFVHNGVITGRNVSCVTFPVVILVTSSACDSVLVSQVHHKSA